MEILAVNLLNKTPNLSLRLLIKFKRVSSFLKQLTKDNSTFGCRQNNKVFSKITIMTVGTAFFNYCPSCSSTNFEYTNNFKFCCKDCDFVLYHNIAAAVALVFIFEEKILFTVRNVNPDKGKLDLPGGFIDPGETAEQAACREIEEELGFEINPSDLRYVTTTPNDYLYKNVAYRTLDIFYECKLSSDTIAVKAKDEIQDLVWLKRNEIVLDAIGFVSIRKVINNHYLIN